jgi:hypothetical protein
MNDVKYSKLRDQWNFVIKGLKDQESDTIVNFFPYERSDEYIVKVLDLGFKYEECKTEEGYTIKIWK